MEILDKCETLEDGIYTIPDSAVCIECPDTEHRWLQTDIDAVREFVARYPNFVYASAYGVIGAILISEKVAVISNPEGLNLDFNHGVTALINNCPSRMLILAEND